MKRTLTLLIAFSLQFIYAQSVQTWNSQNGHSFQGTFIRMDAQSITLKGTDGKEVTVPITALDTDSQKQARKEQKKAKKNAPVFTHKNRHLQFSLYPDTTWLSVEFLQGSTVLNNQSYDLSMSFAEVRNGKKWHGIRIKEMVGEIEKSRNDVTMRFRMENDVVLKFVVNLDDKAELTYKFEAEEVPEGLPKLDFRTALKFPELLTYDMKTKSYRGDLSSSGVTFEELPAFFEGYEILADRQNEKATKILYSDNQTKGFGAEKFTVKIPGKKSLQVEAPKSAEEGTLHIWFYNGKAAFEGYNIRALSIGDTVIGAGPFSISLK